MIGIALLVLLVVIAAALYYTERMRNSALQVEINRVMHERARESDRATRWSTISSEWRREYFREQKSHRVTRVELIRQLQEHVTFVQNLSGYGHLAQSTAVDDVVTPSVSEADRMALEEDRTRETRAVPADYEPAEQDAEDIEPIFRAFPNDVPEEDGPI